MALTLFTKDMNVIAALADEPNDVGGLGADELKAKFDEGGLAIKNYINNVLIPETEASIEAAAQGVPSGGGIDGTIIINGSLTTPKYALGSVTEPVIGDGAVTTPKMAPRAVTGNTVALRTIGRENLTDDARLARPEDFPSFSVPGNALVDNSLTTQKYADGSLTTQKYADASVTAAKLAEDAKSKGVEVTLTTGGWSNLTQTVSVEGVTADNNVIVAAAPASREAWNDAEVYCSAQAAGTLTFKCSSVPASAVTVNVVILV